MWCDYIAIFDVMYYIEYIWCDVIQWEISLNGSHLFHLSQSFATVKVRVYCHVQEATMWSEPVNVWVEKNRWN